MRTVQKAEVFLTNFFIVVIKDGLGEDIENEVLSHVSVIIHENILLDF